MKKFIVYLVVIVLMSCNTESQKEGVFENNDTSKVSENKEAKKMDSPTINTTHFWQLVSLNYQSRNMNAGMRSWIFELVYQDAKKKNDTYKTMLNRIYNLSNEPSLQNKIVQKAFVQNKEQFRKYLGIMCGSYSISNPVADFYFVKLTSSH